MLIERLPNPLMDVTRDLLNALLESLLEALNAPGRSLQARNHIDSFLSHQLFSEFWYFPLELITALLHVAHHLLVGLHLFLHAREVLIELSLFIFVVLLLFRQCLELFFAFERKHFLEQNTHLQLLLDVFVVADHVVQEMLLLIQMYYPV